MSDVSSELVARPADQQVLRVVYDEVERRRETLEQSAASNIDVDRLKRVVLSSFTRNPSLYACDPVSVARAVVEAAQVGLEPTGAIGGAHLVPYKNTRTGKMEAQLIIDYRGLVQLARRSGEVSKVVARVVREADEFSVVQGTVERIDHVPYLNGDPGPVTHVYAVVTYKDGTTQHDMDTRAWVETIRKRSKAANAGPWVTDWEEMAKKSILKRLLKLVPQAIEARRVLELEDEADTPPVTTLHVTTPPASNIARIQDRVGAPQRPAAPQAPVAEAGGDDEPPDDARPEPTNVTPEAEPVDESDVPPDVPDEPAPPEPPQAPTSKPRATKRTTSNPSSEPAPAQRPSAEVVPPATDGTCDAVPPKQLGMTERCLLRGEHKVHRSSEGTWPAA